MTNRILVSSMLVAALTTTGCYKATFYPDPAAAKGETHEEWSDFFVFGLVGSEEFKVERFCPDGEVTLVRTGGNFATGLVSLLTIGIYTPRKIYVSCGANHDQADARVLEIDATVEGRPLRAVVHQSGRDRSLSVERLNANATRLRAEGSES